ncbi:MAG: TRAP transporter large permease [Bacillota bacterium]|jgi:tripartite ATP-independent transporter DctM subunit|nr:TRAP transporter large permease [Bacillota bacterium]NLD12148.1 TRAP transporter large permease [Bacillota bacterium]HOB89689.1 TRAP transporter large permease [Bacillota bacterium]HQE03448.1 TRAP transporter large permease [Bacillota bacterium]
MSVVLTFLGIFAFFILLNCPIIYAIIATSWIMLRWGPIQIPVSLIGQKLLGGINSFPLLAVPFFMLAANIMTNTSILRRLVDFVTSIIGFVRSGLAIVNVVVSMICAGMSGSATADTAGASAMIMHAMIEEGYDRPFSVAVTGASSTIGIIIPPSIPLIIYAWVSNSSVSALFLAGIIPGILIGLAQILLVMYKGHVRNYPKHPRVSFRQMLKNTYKAIPVLILPIIILGGIFTGVFTATEAAVVAVFYAFVLGLLLRELRLDTLIKCLAETGVTSAVSLTLIGAAAPLSWILALNNVPNTVVNWFLSVTSNPTVFMLMIVVFMLAIGCVMDNDPVIMLTTPMFLPAAMKLGISPIFYGTIINIALAIGIVTPPVGCVLFVACAVGKTTIQEVIGEFIPFYLVMIVVLLLLVFFPQLVLYLPMKFMPGAV